LQHTGGKPTLESDEELQRPQRYLPYLRRAESAPLPAETHDLVAAADESEG
jgi:hypothetical protein